VKLRVERDVLAESVAWAARTLPSRPSLPVLAGLVLNATADGLTISSFDYEVSGRVEVDADITDPGIALVSGRLLADIARSLPSAPVVLETEGSRLQLTCGPSLLVATTHFPPSPAYASKSRARRSLSPRPTGIASLCATSPGSPAHLRCLHMR
jgi:DNA polymerase-3 subunit beta